MGLESSRRKQAAFLRGCVLNSNTRINFQIFNRRGGDNVNIYFVRHGQTEENRKRAYYGSMDIDLNDLGKSQGMEAGKLLHGIMFDRIYTSERKRTHQMAELILENQQFSTIVDERLNEMSLGVFEGKDFNEIPELYPEEWKCWSEDWKEYAPPQGESYVDFYRRIESFMNELLQCEADNVLVVTHAGVIRSVCCYVLGGNLDFFWKFASANGDVTLIKYEYGNLFIDSMTHVKGGDVK